MLFAERGWEGTTMAGVADLAGVATQTMYFSFGSKAALLQGVLVARRTGPGESQQVAAREWYVQALAVSDQRRTLALSVEGGTEVLGRLAPLANAMTSAALVDDEFAVVLDQIRSERRAGMSRLIGELDSKGGLALPSSTAIDVLDVVQSMATYQALVSGCGWSPLLYKAWAYRTLTQLLVAVTPARSRKLDLAATADLSYYEELEGLLPT